MPVLTGDAHHLGDDLKRELGGDVDHEVALAPPDDVVDDVDRDLADPFVEPLDHPGGEALVDQEADLGVPGRVHHQHHHPLLLELVVRGLEERDTPLAREHPGVAADLLEVVVAHHAPKPRAVRFRMEVEGCVAAQRVEHVVRNPGHERVEIREVDTGDSRAHRGPFLKSGRAIRPDWNTLRSGPPGGPRS